MLRHAPLNEIIQETLPMEKTVPAKPNLLIRHADPSDAELVVQYMKKLGAFQKMADKITATAPQIKRLMEEKQGEAIFAYTEGKIVGFAYFCQKSSAFTGRKGLYIDGFLVDTEMRDQGLGKTMMGHLCELALDRGCLFLEWGVLDWNTPAIEFYRGVGAYSVDEMTIFRLKLDDLKAKRDGIG